MRYVAICLLVLCTVHCAKAESPFKVITPGKGMHLIEDDECTINGKYVKRISLSSKGAISILYKNNLGSRVKPSVTVLLLDKYGLPVKKATDNWITSISPDESRSNNTYFKDVIVDETLRFTNVSLPKDAGQPKYMYVNEKFTPE